MVVGGGGGWTCYSLHHNIQDRTGQPITHIILCSVTEMHACKKKNMTEGTICSYRALPPV